MSAIIAPRERRKRQEQRADKALIAQAFKALGKNPTQNPAQQIRVLSGYIDQLRKIQTDLEADFGTDASIEVRRVGIDIQRAISLIRRLKIEQVKPDGV